MRRCETRFCAVKATRDIGLLTSTWAIIAAFRISEGLRGSDDKDAAEGCALNRRRAALRRTRQLRGGTSIAGDLILSGRR